MKVIVPLMFRILLLSLLSLWTTASFPTSLLFISHHHHQRRPIENNYAPPGADRSRHTRQTTCQHNNIFQNTALFGRKKGTLGRNVSSADSVPKKKVKRATNVNGEKKEKDTTVKISSSLSEWAKTLSSSSSSSSSGGGDSTSPNDDPQEETSESSLDSGAVTKYEPFVDQASPSTLTKKSVSGKTSRRRERTNVRQASDDLKILQIKQRLDEITDLISSNNLPVKDLVSKIKSLTQLPSPVTLKALLNQKAKDYTLAWVGSDDAICHIGTGLHKVPLARLQDIFLTIGRDGSGEGKTLRLMEVIRILGPFPNVRNTLQGKIIKINSQENDDAVLKNIALRKDTIQICYDSMFDGLGKQITAGTVDNLRYVDLEVIFADERALVCVVPQPTSVEGSDDDIGEKGENVLFFLKEEDLDYKLEELRAA